MWLSRANFTASRDTIAPNRLQTQTNRRTFARAGIPAVSQFPCGIRPPSAHARLSSQRIRRWVSATLHGQPGGRRIPASADQLLLGDTQAGAFLLDGLPGELVKLKDCPAWRPA